MKRKIFTSVALVFCFMVCFAAIADLTGKWTGSIKGPDGNDVALTYIFKVDGNKLTGTAQAMGEPITIDSGKMNGTDFTFKITTPDGIVIPHKGKYYATGDSAGVDIDYNGQKFHTTLKRND